MAILDEHKDILLQGLYGEIFGDSWYIDAGASSHMTSSKLFLITYMIQRKVL